MDFREDYRAEYGRRMNRVLNYIDRHLAEEIDLDQLAEVANFSKFHFHRIFAAWMGETLGDFLRRRRLERGAAMLSCGDERTVLQVAVDTGFGSGEAFARAFKLKFGCTPSAWRDATPERFARQVALSKMDQVDGKDDQACDQSPGHHGGLLNDFGDHPMQVRLVDFPPVRVAYQRRIGAYGPGIGEFWRSKMMPWMQSHGLQDQVCYGIAYDDPSMASADKCRYDACVVIPDDFRDAGQCDIQTLPGGRYAVSSFQGQPLTIAAAWTRLTREWLPSSGMQCDDRPCFEMFAINTAVDPATGEFRCDICIPVRPL